MERLRIDDIEHYLELGRIHRPGEDFESKIIYPVVEGQPGEYSVLGRASGSDLNVALLMAYNHCADFYDRVAAYRLVTDDELARAVGTHGPVIEFLELRSCQQRVWRPQGRL